MLPAAQQPEPLAQRLMAHARYRADGTLDARWGNIQASVRLRSDVQVPDELRDIYPLLLDVNVPVLIGFLKTLTQEGDIVYSASINNRSIDSATLTNGEAHLRSDNPLLQKCSAWLNERLPSHYDGLDLTGARITVKIPS